MRFSLVGVAQCFLSNRRNVGKRPASLYTRNWATRRDVVRVLGSLYYRDLAQQGPFQLSLSRPSAMEGAFLVNELVDMVIDHLHDDKASLRACALVARTFRNSSQYHLLASVALPGGVAAARGLEAFMAFAATSPRVRRFVRCLHVVGEGAWFGKYDTEQMRKCCLAPRHLRFLSTQLPALRRLFLVELLWDSGGPESCRLSTTIHQTQAGTLEKLVIQQVTSLRLQQPGEVHHGIYAQDILDVLSFFSEIEILNFATPRFEVDQMDDAAMELEERFRRLRFPPRLRVRDLVADPDALDSVRSALAYNLLDRACSVKSLQTFRVKVKPGDLDAISHFVDMRGTSIRHYLLDLSAYSTLSRLGKLQITSVANCD